MPLALPIVCWLIAELLVAIVVANAIGVLLTIILLIAGWPIGTWAIRSQGAAAWRRLAAAVNEGRTPTSEVLDGAMVLLGGTLLMIPGFISDVIGVALLLAPTRSLLRPLLVRNLHSRLAMRAARFSRGRPTSTYDVDSTATDVDPPRLRS